MTRPLLLLVCPPLLLRKCWLSLGTAHCLPRSLARSLTLPVIRFAAQKEDGRKEGRKEKGNFEREKEGQQLEQTERGKDRDDVNEVAAAARWGGGRQELFVKKDHKLEEVIYSIIHVPGFRVK